MGIGSFIQYMVPSSDYLLSTSNESKIHILYPLRVVAIWGRGAERSESAPWMMLNGRLPSAGQDDSSLQYTPFLLVFRPLRAFVIAC